MVEVMKIMVTSFKRSVLALLHSVPLTLHQAIANMASTGDSWTLMGMCESVSCWVIAPCFWVLVHTRFCLYPPRVFPQSCVSSDGFTVGLMSSSSKKAYAIPRSAAPRTMSLWQATAYLYLQRRHSKAGLAQSLWGLLVDINLLVSPLLTSW